MKFKNRIILLISTQILLSVPAILFMEKMLIPMLILMILNILLHAITAYNGIKKLLGNFSNSITSMKLENPDIPYLVLEDSIISKIQDQITTLFNDIKVAKESSRYEKEQLSSLISDISHQIKTPLTQLNLYNELLADNKKEKNPLQNEFDETLKHLTWLIEKLMILSRVETGMIQINKKNLDITQTLLKALTSVSPLAKEKKINIIYNNPVSFNLNHDFKWTIEAIFNLLDNAVKYSLEESVIEITYEKRELFYIISIKDRGVGIPQKELNNIYKRFFRGDNVSDRNGVGIGLALSQKIMNMQNGYIHCESELNTGSIFSLFFPIL